MDFVVVGLDSVCFIKDSQFFVTVLLTKLYLNGYFPFYGFFCKFYSVEFIVIMC